VRQALTSALFGAPADVAGDAAGTKARAGMYHAAWKGGDPSSIQPVIDKVLAETAGVAGTPLEAAANVVSRSDAAEWARHGGTTLKFALEH
jgi:hypothetical protein